MRRTVPVNTVQRTVLLLRALNRNATSTLDGLHRDTGLPKATLSRMLQALQQEGLVIKAGYGSYYITSGVSALSSGFRGEPKVVQAAKPLMDELTRELQWPVTVGIHDHGELVVRYSTTSLSPLSFFHSSVGMRLSLVSNAMGRAYLAYCPRKLQDMLIDMLTHVTRETDVLAGGANEIRATLREVRRQGYALRDSRLRPESSTIAVPLMERGHVVASLGLTWFTSVMRTEDAVAQYLAPLKRAAKDISRKLHDRP